MKKAAAFLTLFLLLIGGCDSLRFAASDQQKQIAYSGAIAAQTIAATGTPPGSKLSEKVLDATSVGLSYIGMPDNPTLDFDYAAALSQAKIDAVARPDSNDIISEISDAAEGGLSLAAELAILFGVGGAGIGGKKLLDWINLARSKSTALAQIVKANKDFLNAIADDTRAIGTFKQLQGDAQSPETKTLVTQIKHS